LTKQIDINFNDVYHEHCDMVYNLCLNYLHNQEESQELTQDVFVKIHNQISEFNNKSTYKTWIYRIAVNSCLDFLKFKQRNKRFGFMTSLFNDNNQEKSELPKEFNHPGVALEDKEAVQVVLNHINTLNKRQKTVLILRVIEDLNIKEISEIMEIGIKATESLLARAKTNLKKKLITSE
jgi:RNA polymerase sigma factor (sigma-70 family)